MGHGIRGAFAETLRRDLLIALRRRGDIANPLVFFVIVIALFPLGIGPTPEDQINPNFVQRTLKAQSLEEEILKPLYAHFCNFHLRKGLVYSENIHTKLIKLADGLFIQGISHPPWGKNGKSKTVRNIIDGRKLMFHGMAAPRLTFSTTNKSINCP